MASGQTPAPAQPGQYPGYAPVYQPAPRPAIEYMRPLFSDVLIAVAVVIGLFLVMLGSVFWGIADENTLRDGGQIVKAVGMFLITVAMLVGALVRVDVDKWVRVALILGAVLLISWVGFWWTTW